MNTTIRRSVAAAMGLALVAAAPATPGLQSQGDDAAIEVTVDCENELFTVTSVDRENERPALAISNIVVVADDGETRIEEPFESEDEEEVEVFTYDIVAADYPGITTIFVKAGNNGEQGYGEEFAVSFDSCFDGLITIGSITTSGRGGSWTLDGVAMTSFRSKLLDPAFAGLVGADVEIIDGWGQSGDITTESLIAADVDVFYVGYVFSNRFAAPAEPDALRAWVEQGGIAVVNVDDPEVNAHPISGFAGYTPGVNPGGSGFALSPALPAHPVVDGCIGDLNVGPAPITGGGSEQAFQTVGASAVVPMVYAGGHGAFLAIEPIGDGWLIATGDVDISSNFTVSTSNLFEPTDANDVFSGNLYGYIAELAGAPGC